MALNGPDRPRNRPSTRRTGASKKAKVPLTKYYRSGDPATAERSPFRPSVGEAQRRRWLGRFIDVVIVATVLFSLSYTLIVKPLPRLVVSDNSYRSANTYKQAVASELEALKNRNKITLDEKEIEFSLKKQFAEIASAEIELPLINQIPIVKLEISKPSFFLLSGGQNYIVDSQGRAAGISADLPQIKNLQSITDQSGFKVTVGKQVLSSTEIGFLKTVIAQMKTSKVPIQSLALPPSAAELDLRTSDRGYYVRFFLGGDALQQVGQYLASRHNFDQSGTQPQQYLDVRVPGKIFYK